MRHFVIFNLPFGFYCLLSALKFTLYTSIHFEALTFSKRKLLGGAVHPRSSSSCGTGSLQAPVLGTPWVPIRKIGFIIFLKI